MVSILVVDKYCLVTIVVELSPESCSQTNRRTNACDYNNLLDQCNKILANSIG